MNHKVNCLACGAELEYEDKYSRLRCCFCGEEYESTVKCKNGHFVCDRCHSLSANEIISHLCINSKSKDPVETAISLMKNPKVAMHGPEHHLLVPAVLLAVYYNLKNDSVSKEERIKIAQQRASNVLGGFCGYYGACGAAIGTGIFVSLITGANPLCKREWQLSNLMTARSLLSIASIGGPRCCKRVTFLAIIEASRFLQEHFGISIPVTNSMKCEFSSLNKECLTADCPFHSDSHR